MTIPHFRFPGALSALLSLLVIAGISCHPGLLFGQIGVTVADQPVRSAQPLCGLYALMGAARSLDKPVDPGILLDDRFVSHRQGSSVQDLCQAAVAIGLEARPLQGLTVSSLRRSRAPLLLHLNRSRLQTTSRHWVLFLGDERGMARIFDAPAAVSRRPYADLLAEWDGVAIRISDPNDTRSTGSIIASPYPPLLVCLAIVAAMWARELLPGIAARSTLVTSLSVLTGAAIIANVWHALSPNGIHRNPSAVALVTRYHYALSLPEIAVSEMEELVARQPADSSVSIVDARPQWAYQAGHIPNAICVPVDSSPEQLARAVAHLSEADTIIVYCQSRGCRWDEMVARHLVFSGLGNVMTFPGGWQEWEESHRNER